MQHADVLQRRGPCQPHRALKPIPARSSAMASSPISSPPAATPQAAAASSSGRGSRNSAAAAAAAYVPDETGRDPLAVPSGLPLLGKHIMVTGAQPGVPCLRPPQPGSSLASAPHPHTGGGTPQSPIGARARKHRTVPPHCAQRRGSTLRSSAPSSSTPARGRWWSPAFKSRGCRTRPTYCRRGTERPGLRGQGERDKAGGGEREAEGCGRRAGGQGEHMAHTQGRGRRDLHAQVPPA